MLSSYGNKPLENNAPFIHDFMSEGEFLCEQTMEWFCETEGTPT